MRVSKEAREWTVLKQDKSNGILDIVHDEGYRFIVKGVTYLGKPMTLILDDFSRESASILDYDIGTLVLTDEDDSLFCGEEKFSYGEFNQDVGENIDKLKEVMTGEEYAYLYEYIEEATDWM